MKLTGKVGFAQVVSDLSVGESQLFHCRATALKKASTSLSLPVNMYFHIHLEIHDQDGYAVEFDCKTLRRNQTNLL